MNTNRLGIIGIGRLGLAFALQCERSGYGVIGCDTREDYIRSIEHGGFTTSEPYIEEYLADSKAFMATTDLEATVLYADLLFIFVATPSLPDGSYDHSAIDRIITDLLRLNGEDTLVGKILVIGCTTMPGYTKTVQERVSHTGMEVIYNPEFIAQGDIINGLKSADMVLIGTTSPLAQEAVKNVYYRIMDKVSVFNVMTPTAAEITKISINCFLTMKIAYANMIGDIVISSGIEDEVKTVLSAIGSDSRIGTKYLGYGFGYGGPCLVRDNKALNIHARTIKTNSNLCGATDFANDTHNIHQIEHYIKKNPDKNVPFVFSQLAYKKGTDILTESQQYRLCKDLLMAGYQVDIRESPSVIEQVKKELEQYSNQITYGTREGYNITL